MTNGSASNTTPNWTSGLHEVFFAYSDVVPFFYVFMFALPIILMYASTGSVRMTAIVGLILSMLAFAFLPPSVIALAVLTFGLSFGALIWGLFKE